jgi:SpoVK/Ycf46/Vps4 family AAA+-type ATPase
VSPARFTLDGDVVLPQGTRNQIEECLTKIRFHHTIYDTWNFRSVDPVGSSSILNFFGPSGSGKTLTAEALAGTLGLPVIQIGIAELESKFMGETAKNIQAAFNAAEQQHAVVVFDEADTLLGKRLSSVTQGIDNEVNAMRSTLLIELERFTGIAIFATNFAHNYDSAFRGRITHHIRFELPDLAARERLWDRFLLETIPTAGNRRDLVARCATVSEGFSGRDIRTCMRLALPKALMQASRQQQEASLTLDHLLAALSQVRAAMRDVGSAVGRSVEDIAAARLMGIEPQERRD